MERFRAITLLLIGAAEMACGSAVFNPPFPFPPPGKLGRAGSPHAGSTLRASQKRWLASLLSAPPHKRAAAPLCIPPLRSVSDCRGSEDNRNRPNGLPRRYVYKDLGPL